MRIGILWNLDAATDAAEAWRAAVEEIALADRLGFESAWIAESRAGGASCPAPSVFLTYSARRTRSIRLHAVAYPRREEVPVRLAEEIAVLDLFSRGRAGLAIGSREGASAEECGDFVLHAWTADAFSYRGRTLTFPAHVSGEEGKGGSTGAGYPPADASYLPQWERGGGLPDHLGVTPKPIQVPHPALHVEPADDAGLEWAARRAIPLFFTPDLSREEVIRRAGVYRKASEAASGAPRPVEHVLVRRIAFHDGPPKQTMPHDIHGGPKEIVSTLRSIAVEAGIRHIVWVRDASEAIDLKSTLRLIAAEVHPYLQD